MEFPGVCSEIFINISCLLHKKDQDKLDTYRGSRYPGVPAILVVTCVKLSVLNALDSPKSAIFAVKSLVQRILELFISLWIMGGVHPLCR